MVLVLHGGTDLMEATLFKRNWKQVLFGAWSSRIIWIAGLLTGLEVFLPLVWDQALIDFPVWVYPIAMLLLTVMALVARLMVQKGDW